MTLITFKDGNVVMHGNKVGTEQACCDLPTCCNCLNNCECEVTVTYAGITFPADGQFRTTCIDENGPFLNGFVGAAAMASTAAVVDCRNTFDVYVRVLNRYSTIAKVNNAFPVVGNVCDAWFGSGTFESAERLRDYAWKRCNRCACPDPDFAPEFMGSNGDDLANGLACVAEYNAATRTEPTFAIDCGPCP